MVQRQIDIKAEDVPSLNYARQFESEILVKAIMSHVHSFHKVCGYTHRGSQQNEIVLFVSQGYSSTHEFL